MLGQHANKAARRTAVLVVHDDRHPRFTVLPRSRLTKTGFGRCGLSAADDGCALTGQPVPRNAAAFPLARGRRSNWGLPSATRTGMPVSPSHPADAGRVLRQHRAFVAGVRKLRRRSRPDL
ncbi:unnamed protein product, partial [Ixodes pacificus]